MFNLSPLSLNKSCISKLFLAGLLVLATLFAGLASAGASSFSGKVTDLSLAPLAGIQVQVLDPAAGTPAGDPVTTQADGTFSYGVIPAGSYRVEFRDLTFGSSAPAVYYSNKLSLADSDLLTLGEGVVATGVNAVIGAWGQIGGKATDASQAGIPGIQVTVCDANGLALAGLPAVTTKADGSFLVGGINPALGPFKVKFAGNSTYLTQWFGGAAQQSGAVPVGVVAYQTTFVSQVLPVVPTVNVAGTVTNALGAPLANMQVYLYDAALNFYPVGGVLTQADGSYAMTGIAPGTYGAVFSDPANVYRKQYYSLKTSRPAPAIVVGGTPVTGINATLGTGIPTVTAFSAPATAGALTVTGISVTAVEPNGVTGYLLTESATPPTASAAGWSATSPTSYTFASAGAKTLYAWAKGVAGVSTGIVSRPVTVTLTPLLTVQLSGTGSGSVNSVPGGISCATGSASGCSALFNGSASLTAAASGDSVFAGWTGICAGSGATCSASFSANTTVSAVFNLAPPARIGTTPYPSLQAAYDAATTGQVIELKEGVLAGTLTATHGVNVTVAGGYLPDYSSRPGETTLGGQIFLRGGEVKFVNVNLK